LPRPPRARPRPRAGGSSVLAFTERRRDQLPVGRGA
jgi:hypothetical protein